MSKRVSNKRPRNKGARRHKGRPIAFISWDGTPVLLNQPKRKLRAGDGTLPPGAEFIGEEFKTIRQHDAEVMARLKAAARERSGE